MIYLELLLFGVFVYNIYELKKIQKYVLNNKAVFFNAPKTLKDDIIFQVNYNAIMIVFSFFAFVITYALTN